MAATDQVALEALPESRQAILVALKKAGEARASALADGLGITVSAVRQHLAGLAEDGLVEHRSVRAGPGRPGHLYALSADGDRLFPRTYGELTLELLEHVEAEDPELIERVFERRRLRRVARAQTRLAGLSFAERVYELTRILDEDGYLAEVVPLPDGAYRIVEHNCAILAVAARYGTACGTELEFLREVLPEASVDRVTHLLAGGHCCAYEVRPSTPASKTRTPRKPSPTS